MTIDGEGLSIGAAAGRAGVNVETIRYYQRRGLLPRPPSRRRGIRRYPLSLVHQVRFIKRAQRLGLTLDEVAQLLALAEGKKCSQACGLAERKMAEVERKIADLKTIHEALGRLANRCHNNGASDLCPLVESLGGAAELSEMGPR